MIIKLIICKTKPHLFSVAISVSDRRIKGVKGNTLQVTKRAWYNLLYFEKMDCLAGQSIFFKCIIYWNSSHSFGYRL